MRTSTLSVLTLSVLGLAGCPSGKLDDSGGACLEGESEVPVSDLSDLVLADLNGDGAPDIANVGFYNTGVSVALNNGDGTLGAKSGYTVAEMNSFVLSVADLNGDGSPDLAIRTSDEHNDDPDPQEVYYLSVLMNQGDGTFGDKFSYLDVYFSPYTAGDMDGDGKIDFASATGDDTVGVLINACE